MPRPDVILINPAHHRPIFQGLADEFTAVEPPVFAGLFATYLRLRGVGVEIIDAPTEDLTPEQVADLVVGMKPILAVIVCYGAQPSASTQHMTAAGEISRLIKEGNHTISILMTGPHVAALPEQTMREEMVDFVCDLEGPATIFKTVMALQNGIYNFHDIPSLWWRPGGDQILAPKTKERLLDNLDAQMPGIAWDLLPMQKYRSHNWHSFDHINQRSPYAAVHTSLSCPFSCGFCMINAPFGGPAYRMWGVDAVMKELDYLGDDLGIVNVKFVDEMFVLNPRHVKSICQALVSREYKVNIWAYARVDTVKDDMLDVLKAAGVNWLCLGIESASDYVRDGADKKYSNEDIIRVVEKIRSHGIYVIGNYIFGLPDDTQERMHQTLDLALELNCEYANFYSAMAYPGSQLYREAVMQGRELPVRWEDYSQHGYGTLPLANDYLTSAEILAFRDMAFSMYFTNPSYMMMVEQKFGAEVVDHIIRLRKVPLRRKLLGD